MKVSVEFEIGKLHCLECPLRDKTGWDNCVIQKDDKGNFLDFEKYDEQMKNCPLKIVKED